MVKIVLTSHFHKKVRATIGLIPTKRDIRVSWRGEKGGKKKAKEKKKIKEKKKRKKKCKVKLRENLSMVAVFDN